MAWCYEEKHMLVCNGGVNGFPGAKSQGEGHVATWLVTNTAPRGTRHIGHGTCFCFCRAEYERACVRPRA